MAKFLRDRQHGGGNTPYDDSDPAGSGYTVPGHPEAPGTSRDSNSWEMPDSQKGDIARAMFYMDVRYEGMNGEPDLVLTDDMATVTASGSRMGRLSALLVWHLLDPVSPEERLRNDRVDALYQKNRNPFVDRPEWVIAIFGNPLVLNYSVQGTNFNLSWAANSRRLKLDASNDLLAWTYADLQPHSGLGTGFVSVDFRSKQGQFFRLAVR